MKDTLKYEIAKQVLEAIEVAAENTRLVPDAVSIEVKPIPTSKLQFGIRVKYAHKAFSRFFVVTVSEPT